MSLFKPLKLPRWATGVTAEITEPSEGKKDVGYVDERPTFGSFNWFLNVIYNWLEFFLTFRHQRQTNIPYLAITLGLPRSTGRGHTVTVGSDPTACAFDGRYIWVLNSASLTISLVDPLTMAIAYTVSLAAYDVVYHIIFDGTFIWVSAAASAVGKLVKINPTSRSIVNVVTVDNFPDGMCADTGFIWVAIRNEDEVLKIDLSDDSIAATISVGTDPTRLCSDGEYIWVATRGSGAAGYGVVNKIKIADDTVSAINVGEIGDTNILAGIAYDGRRVWVANTSQDKIFAIDVISDAVGSALAIGTAGNGTYELLFDGHYLRVGTYTVSAIYRINVDALEVIDYVVAGDNASGMTIDGSHVWVACAGPNWVQKLIVL